jgi:hypothetical protein
MRHARPAEIKTAADGHFTDHRQQKLYSLINYSTFRLNKISLADQQNEIQ